MHALIVGTLWKDPVARTSKNGNPYATCIIRSGTPTEALWCNAVRKAAEQVTPDAPLSSPTSSDEYVQTPEVVMNRDGGRLERSTEGRWYSAGHPGSK